MAFDYKGFTNDVKNTYKKNNLDDTVDLDNLDFNDLIDNPTINNQTDNQSNTKYRNVRKKTSSNTNTKDTKTKKTTSKKSEVVSNPKILFVNSPLKIVATPCAKLNSFYKSATKTESFMNKCYNNTFKIDLTTTNSPNNVARQIYLNNKIDSFFIHFDFEKLKDKSSLEKNIILAIENITYDTTISDNCHLIYTGNVKYHRNLDDTQAIDNFILQIKFTIKNDTTNNDTYNIERIEISISDFNHVSEMNLLGKCIYSVKNKIDVLVNKKSKNTDANKYNDLDGNIVDMKEFKSTTRSQSAYFSPYKPLKIMQDNTNVEYNIILRYYSQFNLIQCPICNTPVKNLGISGIVLQAGNSNSEAQETSNEIFSYLKSLTTNRNITEEDKKLLEMVYGVIVSNIENTEDKDISFHKLNLNTNDDGKSMITIECKEKNGTTQTYSTDDLKKYTRIPLGELVSFNEDKPENLDIKPFTSTDFLKSKQFLDQFNEITCENYDKTKDYHTSNQLFLLKYGKISPKVDNFDNYLIHDTLITQLCDTCWNPLPQDFYNYDEVITQYYYGNPSTGKTVLLCSEYNEIEKYNETASKEKKIKLNVFNDTHLLYGADGSYSSNSYINKAIAIKNGNYFVGTNALDIIPGKLSSLTVNNLDKSTDYDIMFNSYDMAGIKSSSRWNSDKNLVYVYSLLDDPLTLSENENSLYGKLMNSFTHIGDNCRNYNIQVYLTKIDEYPYFIYQQIKKLNTLWTEYSQIEDLDYIKNSMIYTLALLEILENSLKVDFKDRPVEEIISPKLLDIIQRNTQITSFSGLTYYQAHEKIVNTKQYNTIESMDVIGNYLHSLDVMKDNYIKLRTFITSLIEIITNNILKNTHSFFCFRMYAVSSTGYSKLETEDTSIDKTKIYNPEFVIEAQDILKHTTYEFVKDKRQYNDSSNTNSIITQIFNPTEYFSIQEDDFLGSNPEYLAYFRTDQKISIKDFLTKKLYSNSLKYSDLYVDNPRNIESVLKNSKEQQSIKRLYILYCKNNFDVNSSVENN